MKPCWKIKPISKIKATHGGGVIVYLFQIHKISQIIFNVGPRLSWMTRECRKASSLDKGQEMYVLKQSKRAMVQTFHSDRGIPKKWQAHKTVQMPPCSESQKTMPLYVIVTTERHTETGTDGEKQKQKEREGETSTETDQKRERTSVPLCPLSFCS